MGKTISNYRLAALRTPLVSRLKVGERYGEGTVYPISTRIQVDGADISLQEVDGPALHLREEFISAVFARYAAPLESHGDFSAQLRLPDGSRLLHMLYVPDFDVVPKDYLVWLPKDEKEEARVELCVHLVPPLLHLARAAQKNSMS